jgi:hypothetical protein
MEDHGRRQTRGALDAIAGIGVCLDQAGVNGKALTADQPSIDAGLLEVSNSRQSSCPDRVRYTLPLLRE